MSSWIASPSALILGAITGLLFGFLLQKGGVTRFDVILGQFLLRDFTMLKVMLSAVVVGGLGIYGMRAAGMDVPLHLKSTVLLANAFGGVIFGVGMGLLGYCPGTGVAALGDGSRHALAGVVGMLVGAAVYAELHPWAKATLGAGALGKVTLVDLTGLAPWWFLGGLALLTLAGFRLLGPRGADRQTSAPTAPAAPTSQRAA